MRLLLRLSVELLLVHLVQMPEGCCLLCQSSCGSTGVLAESGLPQRCKGCPPMLRALHSNAVCGVLVQGKVRASRAGGCASAKSFLFHRPALPTVQLISCCAADVQ